MSLRIAVVGAGHLGRIHARLLSSVDDVKVVGITDPSDAARATAAEQLGVATFASHTQVVDQVDAVVIASPSDLHYSIAMDLLAAGKHLLIEKPITIQPKEAFGLVELARREQLTLQVGHVERFNPAWTAAAEVTNQPKYIEATRASSFPGRCLDVGVVMDLMIHDIDLVLSLTTARLLDVQATGISVISDHEDLAEARLTFACGLVANLKASRVSLSAARTMQVFGANGFADIDFSVPSATLIRPSESVVTRTLELASLGEPKTMRDKIFGDHLRVESPTLESKNAILEELHDFVISIQSGSEPTVSGYAGARSVETADRILQVIGNRQWNGAADFASKGAHVLLPERIKTRFAA